MSLTAKQRAQYVKDGGNHCPYCGSLDVESGPVQADGSVSWAPVSCSNCNKEWEDQYDLAAIQEKE